jgi:PAS domain S-box-containing protein
MDNIETNTATTILLVEDDQLLNKSIQMLLRREGFTIEGFLNGAKALERMAASSENVLLLLDYSLPDMTAKEVIAAMRERGLDIPFVIVTGHGDELLAVEMMKLGALDYIVKSIQFHEVVPAKIRHVIQEIAGRKKLAESEVAVKQAAVEWQNTFDSITDAVLILDKERKIMRFNLATLALTGKSAEELLGRHCCTVIHGSQDTVTDCPMSRMEKSLSRESGEMQFGDRFFGITVDPVFDAEKRLAGAVHVISDITAKKRVDDALQKSEARFRGLFETMTEGVSLRELVYDARGCAVDCRVLDVNPAFVAHTGISREKAIGATSKDLHGLNDPCFLERYDKAVSTGEAQQFESFFGPTKRHFRITAFSMGLGRFATVFEDITDRKMAEQALRESEEKFRNLADLLPSLVYEMDLNGTITYVNKNGLEMSGYSREDIDGGFSAIDFISPEDRPRALEKMKSLLTNGKAGGQSEYLAITKDGRKFAVLSTSTPVFKDGIPAGVRGILFDITDRKQAEEKQKHLEDQLRQSQKLEAIGQLAGGVAHDFNNLLGGIMGNAELIKMHSGKDPTMDRYADIIVSSSVKAADLTRQLLTFARKARASFAQVDLNAGVKNIIELLTHTVDRKIRIDNKCDKNPYIIQGDSTMIENAILNIAINARDAMPRGGTISFSIAKAILTKASMPSGSEDCVPGAYVGVAISDTGTGIDKETQKRMFEPFFTTKELGKGTGLGLAAVYGCVRQHNGYITVDSKMGVGTTFTIYLPETAVVSAKEESATTACVTGHGRVLVVDDEKVVGETVCEILRGLGYSPEVFDDPVAALDFFKENYKTVDAVMLDIIMPKMNGLDLFRALKKLDPEVRVIVSSGYSDNDQEKRIMQEGAKEFVQKPYRASELSRVMAGVILCDTKTPL